MSAPAMTSEKIALTEKKVDMALDDIIKMSKDKATKSYKKHRVSNKSHKLFDGAQNKTQKVRQYMDSRSSLRQGALAQRRTSFHGNKFPKASEAAKNAVVAPIRNKTFNKNRTGNWNRPRANAPVNRQVNAPARGFAVKPRFQQQQRIQQQQRFQQQQRQRQQQQRQQQQLQTQQQTMPKTLDSLFASMKEQRKQTFGHQNNTGNQKQTFGHQNNTGNQKQTFGHQYNAGNQKTAPVQQRQTWGRGQRFQY